MKIKALLIILLFIFTVLSIPEISDAARFGGGRNFGGKPSMSRPVPSQTIRPQNQIPKQNQPLNQANAQAPMRPAFGGIFGGLLAGTLIGSLLSGHGFAGGGFLDIIIFGLLLYLALKFFAVIKNPATANNDGKSQFNDTTNEYTSSDDGWTNLRSNNTNDTNEIPDSFNSEEFLRGAKMLYNRLQSSWDKKDIEDIAQFTTNDVLDNVKQQFLEDPNPSKTQILLVNAKILKVENKEDEQRVQVLFDVLLKEDESKDTPQQVLEIWHFLRNKEDSNWKLDGIQQVA